MPASWAAWLVVLWGSTLIVSLAGWGGVIARYLDDGKPSPLGLRLGWGTAAVLLLGGPLLALHLARGRALAGLVGLGVGLLLVDLWLRRAEIVQDLRSWARDAAANPATAVVWLVIAAGALVILGASAFEPTSTFRTDDDACAYLAFAKEIVQTGGSEQPFSIRHVFSLNGQFFLAALLLDRLHPEQLFVLDRGIFLVIGLFAVAGLSPRPWLQRPAYTLLPELTLVLLPNIRVNTASLMSGVVALITLYASMVRSPPGSSARHSVVVGISAATAVALRPTYAAPVAFVLIVGYGLPLWRSRTRPRAPIVEGLVVIAAALVFLAPWMVVGWRSDGTPMYPFLQGTVRRLAPNGPMGLLFVPRQIWAALMTDETFRAPFVVILAGLCLEDPSERKTLRAWVLAPLVAVFVLVRAHPRVLAQDEHRYIAPSLLAAVFVVGARAMEILGDLGSLAAKREGVAAATAAIAMVVHLHDARTTTVRELTDAMNTWRKVSTTAPVLGMQSGSYEAAQSHAEPGATILAMTMRPYLLDYARNRIRLLDMPGLAAPKGGFPIDGTDDDYVKYLRDCGIRYLVISADRPDPYDLNIWRPRLKEVAARTDVEAWPQASWAPVMVPIVDTMERLAKAYTEAFADNNLRLIDLTKPRQVKQPSAP
jgi:hypothetical protein